MSSGGVQAMSDLMFPCDGSFGKIFATRFGEISF